MSQTTTAPARKRKKYRQDIVRENIEVWLMMLPVLVVIFIFSYIPLWGVIIAFQNYQPGSPFFDPNNWVGLKHIRQFINSPFFSRLIINTLRLSLLQICFAFWVPIIFALFLNEVTNMRFKKVVQTCSYLPYFVSSVVVAGMVISFLDVNGLINNLLGHLGIAPYEYMTDPNSFPSIYTITTIW